MLERDEKIETQEKSGVAEGLTLLAGLAVAVVFWRQLRDLIAWWWDASTLGESRGYGTVVLFGLGVFVGLVVAVGVLAMLAKMLRFAGDLGRAARDGWREGDS